jgi:hypothetical protein
MIVSAVALLVVATIFLVIGILSSSVTWLVLSVVATVAASATLFASFAHYRSRAEKPAGYPGAYAVAAPPPQPASAAPTVDLRASVPAGWDGRPAAELTRIVGTLSLDELHAVRRHEVEGKHRKTVLTAIDARIDDIVSVRKTLQTT